MSTIEHNNMDHNVIINPNSEFDLMIITKKFD